MRLDDICPKRRAAHQLARGAPSSWAYWSERGDEKELFASGDSMAFLAARRNTSSCPTKAGATGPQDRPPGLWRPPPTVHGSSARNHRRHEAATTARALRHAGWSRLFGLHPALLCGDSRGRQLIPRTRPTPSRPVVGAIRARAISAFIAYRTWAFSAASWQSHHRRGSAPPRPPADGRSSRRSGPAIPVLRAAHPA